MRADVMTPEQRAIQLLRRLVKHGSWYSSAIELTFMEVDGEELYGEAVKILKELPPEPLTLKEVSDDLAIRDVVVLSTPLFSQEYRVESVLPVSRYHLKQLRVEMVSVSSPVRKETA